MEQATRLAVDEAIKAKTRATSAFIIAGGAMLAAMAAAFIAFLALRRYGFQPPW
jgi:glyoxylate carboligase